MRWSEMDAKMVTAIFTALATFAALGTAIAAFLQIRMSNPSALMFCYA
jgi:hypothetical protein